MRLFAGTRFAFLRSLPSDTRSARRLVAPAERFEEQALDGELVLGLDARREVGAELELARAEAQDHEAGLLLAQVVRRARRDDLALAEGEVPSPLLRRHLEDARLRVDAQHLDELDELVALERAGHAAPLRRHGDADGPRLIERLAE